MAEEQENQQAATEEANTRGQFEIQKIYVKNVSLETPGSPRIFREQWKPSVHLDLANSVDDLGENNYEVTLAVTATVSHENKTLYLVEVQQAGIFLMAGFPRELHGRLVATVCPSILFPYAREAISRPGHPRRVPATVAGAGKFRRPVPGAPAETFCRNGATALSVSPGVPIMVAGAGSWGTALALVLARNGHRTFLWDCLDSHLERLIAERCNNHHLPGHGFPANLVAVRHFTPLPGGVRHVLLATPCAGLADVLEALQALPDRDFSLCLACKGIEPGTLTLNHLLVEQYLPGVPVAVLSGPSFAREVAAGLPTAVTIASQEASVAGEYCELFHCEVFRTYAHEDVIGVQVGGAVKNVMAIATGMADGLHYGANTRAALIARGLAEIMRLGQAMGGRADTFTGLAGLGDLVLTCTDDQSRNRRFGLALAQGRTPEQALAEIGQAVEGLHTARVVGALAGKYGMDLPISEQVLKVIDGSTTPKQAAHELLSRAPKPEMTGGHWASGLPHRV